MAYLKSNAEATMIQRSLLIEYIADNESFKRTAKKPAAALYRRETRRLKEKTNLNQ